MKFYFLDKSDSYFLIFLSLIVFFFLPILGLIFSLAMLSILLLLRVRSKKDSAISAFDLVSPVSGKVLTIVKGEHENQITIKMPCFGDWGVYAPRDVRVMSFAFIKKEKKRKSFGLIPQFLLKNHPTHSDCIELQGDSYNYKLHFNLDVLEARELFLNIDIGDNISKQSVVGYRLWGGNVTLFLPTQVCLNINEGDSVVGGRSTLGVAEIYD